MYNLLMVGRNGYWDEQDVSTFEYDRYLSYTHEALKQRLLPLTDQAVAELVGIPVLFAYEFKREIWLRTNFFSCALRGFAVPSASQCPPQARHDVW